MVLASLVFAALGQSPEIVLDPQVSEVAVFKPGLVYVVREAVVPAGLHQFRLKNVPQALDGTLWYETPDEARLSELRTTIDVHAKVGKRTITSIRELLAASVNHQVELSLRFSRDGKNAIEKIQGKLLGIEPSGLGTLLLANKHMRSFDPLEVFDVNTEGLPAEVEKTRPRIDLRFRVNATRPSRVRFCSIEVGAAWVAKYRLTMKGAEGVLEAQAQLGLGSLSLSDSHVRLATGFPDLDSGARLDLATGSASLSRYLANLAGRLSQSATDPFEVVEGAVPTGAFRNTYGATLKGGQGLVGDSIDFITYDPTDNSLVVRGGDEAPRFLPRAIEAVRVEDVHLYDYGQVTLPAGGRLTRELSTMRLPLNTLYRLNANSSSGFQRVLRLHNASSSGWPAGTVFLQADGIPISQLPITFTAPGQDANLVTGPAEDLLYHCEASELERHAKFIWWYPRAIDVLFKEEIEVTNTRDEPIDIEVNYDLSGRVTDSAGAMAVKTAKWDLLNPTNALTWRLRLAPHEQKRWTVKYHTTVT